MVVTVLLSVMVAALLMYIYSRKNRGRCPSCGAGWLYLKEETSGTWYRCGMCSPPTDMWVSKRK